MTDDIKPVAWLAPETGQVYRDGEITAPESWATPLYTREQLDAAVADALERAAKACDDLAADADESMELESDERFGVYAKKYRRAAAELRALAGERREG